MKSRTAAGLAVKMGYRNVYWYRDGLAGWEKAGYPTTYTIKLTAQIPAPIEPSDLNKMIEKGLNPFLIDIRGEKSIRKFGIIDGPRILFYPLFRLHSLCWELPRNKMLIIYDIKGKQAPTAVRYLLQQHFKKDKVAWLKGGIDAWQKAGLPVKLPQWHP